MGTAASRQQARWHRMEELFHAAAGLPAAEQAAFLESQAKDDPELLSAVLLMLENHRATSFLDEGIGPVASDVLSQPDALPFENIGPYRLFRRLGEGGMGVVYLAERSDWQTLVAIKFPRDAWISTERSERFSAEQRLLAQLTHPAIARIYEAGTLPNGTPWFAMEYVEGEPITDHCDKHGATVDDRLQLIRSVCDAVQYAHTQTIIHRDLKPSNILVTPDGAVKLLDFGIAKQLEDSRDHLTRTGHHPLSIAYAAPEQVLENRIGTYTDVYSLGVILYQLLTGSLPFDLSRSTPSQADEILKTQEAERPSISARRTGLSGRTVAASQWADLDVLVLTAMHKDIAKRYSSVDALRRDIDHYRQSEPLEARPDTVAYRVRKFLKRRRTGVLASAAVLVLIIGLVSFYTVRLSKARDAALAEAARTRRVQTFIQQLFEGEDNQTGPSKDVTVSKLLDRGLQQAHALDNDPAIQGNVYDIFGSIYGKLGDAGKAEWFVQSAVTKLTVAAGPDNLDLAEPLLHLSLLRTNQARFPEAEALARRALAICQQQLPVNDAKTERCETVLGQALEASGKNEEAIRVLSAAAQVQASLPGDIEDYHDSLNLLGSTYFNLGDFAKTESLIQQNLPYERQKYGSDTPGIAEDLTNLAAVQYRRHEYREAEQNYRKVVAIYRSWYPAGNSETGDILRMFAQDLTGENKLDEAEQAAREALADEQAAYGSKHPRVGFALDALAAIEYRKGNAHTAEADFLRAVELFRGLGDHKHLPLPLTSLGNIYAERKEYPRAEQFYNESLSDSAGVPDVTELRARTETAFGELLLTQRRYDEAEAHLLASKRIWLDHPQLPRDQLPTVRKDLIDLYVASNQPAKAAALKHTPATSN